MYHYLLKRLIRHFTPSRMDGGPVLKYFFLKDYPDLSGEKFEFYSNKNLLKGYKYHIGNGPYKGAILFHHGMGGGHNAYMDLLHELTVHGYLVYAYDNSCCYDSEGKHWWNFASSLIDQYHFYKWLETDKDQIGLKRIAFGHSWGGYTAVNALRYKIDKVVSISGFRNVINLLEDISPFLKKHHKWLVSTQKHYYGELGISDTKDLLSESIIPVLLIHGDLDDVVKYQYNFVDLKDHLSNKKNIEFYSVKDRYHQPYISQKGEKYYRYLNESGIALGKLKDYPPIDYSLLLEKNEIVFNKIFEFIDK